MESLSKDCVRALLPAQEGALGELERELNRHHERHPVRPTYRCIQRAENGWVGYADLSVGGRHRMIIADEGELS